MTQPIGIRLPEDIIKQIEEIGKKEMQDRSTIIRNLIMIGYHELMKKKAAEEYVKGSITLSEAAHQASLTVWSMEEYLIQKGFKSNYSIFDLEEEIKTLNK